MFANAGWTGHHIRETSQPTGVSPKELAGSRFLLQCGTGVLHTGFPYWLWLFASGVQ